jgi:hypothetical protein
MKIFAYLLLVLLFAGAGGAAYFYINMYQPLEANNKKFEAGMPELDKTRADLKKYKEKEKNETAWMKPVIDAFSSVLSNEIKTGAAEVLSAGNKVVVNISEQALYMPGSKTFTRESPPLLAKLDSLLRDDSVKGKNIYIGNTTQAAPAQGRGARKIPAKDARTLAAERSAELTKYLEKKGVNPDALIEAAYSSKHPESGSKIKERKTIIIIENPLPVPMVAAKQEPASEMQTRPTLTTKGSTTVPAAPAGTPAPQVQTKPTLTTKGSTTVSTAPTTTSAVPQTRPKPVPIPIRPAQPKAN